MDKFASIRTFCAVAKQGSFSAASREIGVSTAMVSKQIKRLEDDLSVRLLNRSTRHCSLTEAGAEYFDRCERVITYMEDADASVKNLSHEIRGTLKISAPATFGTRYLIPAIVAYKEIYPKIAFDLRMAPQMPDLLEGGFDIAIQAGGTRLDDSDLVARKLGSFRLALCASQEYLDLNGIPRHPNELSRHNCMIFFNDMATDTWAFRGDENELTVSVEGDLRSNQGAALRLAAIEGMGIARLPNYLVHTDFENGRLVEILSEYRSPPRAVHVMYPQRRLMPAKVRSFIDFLAERFETGHGFSAGAKTKI